MSVFKVGLFGVFNCTGIADNSRYMVTFSEMVRNNSLENYKNLRTNCIPFLDKFNVKHFYFGFTSWDGYLAEISTHLEWAIYYAENHLYKTNPFKNNPTNLHSGMYSNETIQRLETIRKESVKFGVYSGLDFIERRSQGIIRYGFSMGDSDPCSKNLLLNELPLLKKFAAYFESEAQSLFQSKKTKAVYLPTLVGPMCSDQANLPKVYLTPQERLDALSSFEEIDRGLIGVALSKRELACIRMSISGSTASEIAAALHLSRRTVEHYIENVKQKLNCESKTDFISKIETLKTLGIFQA